MTAAKKQKTVLSTKGQVILPKVLRDNCGWKPGLQLTAEQTADGILLRREPEEPLFPPTRLKDVIGILKYEGPKVSVAEMKAAVEEAAVERYERSLKRKA